MFKNFRKFAATFFAPNPMPMLAGLAPGFMVLREFLAEISKTAKPLEGLVEFFDHISKWQDGRSIQRTIEAFGEANRGQYDAVLSQLRALASYFDACGRMSSGWNRTQPGEPVTAQKVFMGGIYGLNTLPVEVWLGCKDAPKNPWGSPGMCDMNEYDVMSNHARGFMQAQIPGMIMLIDAILTVAEGRKEESAA